MISLPENFDRERVRTALEQAWSSVDRSALERASSLASLPAYEKFLSVHPKTVPAKGHIELDEVLPGLERGDPAVFDVATEILGKALAPHDVVELGRVVLDARPWKRLRNLTFEAVASLDTEESFRLLLAEPLALHLLPRSGYAGGEALALARLRDSPISTTIFPSPSRAELASWPAERRHAFEAERQAIVTGIDPVEHRLAEDLVSYVGSKGSVESRTLLRHFVAAPNADEGVRARAASSLLAGGHREDLECVGEYLDDPNQLIRSCALRANLALGASEAWDRCGWSRLLEAGSETDANELLYELGRDLAGTGGQPTRGWAHADARFVALSRHWASNPQVPNTELVARELGKGS